MATELGVPITQRIVTLLALAAAFGAAGGAGFTLLIGIAAPADLSPLLALQLFAAVIVGGGAPVAGPLLAFAVIAGIPRAADLLSETGLSSGAANGVMTAAALVACLWLRPHVAARIRRKPPKLVPPGPGPEPTSTNFAARHITDPLGILKGFDIELASGQIHALVGPNGSGKTTLLRVLSDDDDRVVRTFQRPAPLTPLTPYEQVLLALGDDPMPILELTELADRAHATDLGAGRGAAAADRALDGHGRARAAARRAGRGDDGERTRDAAARPAAPEGPRSHRARRRTRPGPRARPRGPRHAPRSRAGTGVTFVVDNVDGLSFTVHPGEIVSVERLPLALAGLERTTGSIRLGDHQLANQPPDRIAALGVSFVPAGRRVFGDLTVEENLTLGAFRIRRDKAAVAARRDRAYARFPWLADRPQQLARTLSGGEQQLLVIARGLMSDPTVLLLEEPSAGLADDAVQALRASPLEPRRRDRRRRPATQWFNPSRQRLMTNHCASPNARHPRNPSSIIALA